jgi:hypothetical protein
MDTSVVGVVLAAISSQYQALAGAFAPAKSFIVSYFGENGLIAAYMAVGIASFLLIYKLVQLAFAAVKYVVVPSVVLAFVGSLIFPLPFVALLPATVALCSVVFLFKG